MPKNKYVTKMKDRIRQIMEAQHMTQQVFAEFVGLSPATLSGIFNGRTNPTLNIVEAIKRKIPDISTDWLMFGSGSMYRLDDAAADGDGQSSMVGSQPPYSIGSTGENVHQPMLDFSAPASTPPSHSPRMSSGQAPQMNGVRNTHPEIIREEIKYLDKPQRRVTEIRVYYDDQTWESFVPSKK